MEISFSSATAYQCHIAFSVAYVQVLFFIYVLFISYYVIFLTGKGTGKRLLQ